MSWIKTIYYKIQLHMTTLGVVAIVLTILFWISRWLNYLTYIIPYMREIQSGILWVGSFIVLGLIYFMCSLHIKEKIEGWKINNELKINKEVESNVINI